jgi:membrane-associated phospholipid phosphatase
LHRLNATTKHLITIAGLIEAGKNTVVWMIKGLLLLTLSITFAFLFWHVRAWIPSIVDYSYKSYAVWIDSAVLGTVPSLWIQQNFRSELLDIFLRWVWLSYSFVILFGSTFVFILRAETKRHLLSVLLTLSTGLFIHYLLPTEPPWMAVEGVVRINGDYFSKLDKNLIAAMPSIHQAVICLFGCSLWNYGFLGKAIAVFYNLIMLIAVVYLGEHYVVDSVAGIFIAILAWFLSEKILIGFSKLKRSHNKWIINIKDQLSCKPHKLSR